MASSPVVLRVQPLKVGHLRGAHVHQAREHHSPMPNVDDTRTHLNRTIAGTGDPFKDVTDMLATVQRAHPDGAVCCEMVLSADDAYFDSICSNWRTGATTKKLETWIRTNTEWLKSTYPGLASATLHLDEGSPHIHAMVVPIAEYEQGFRRGSKTVRKVNYNRVFGDDAKVIFEARRTGNSELTKLGRLQTTYAAAMAGCGLSRGVKNSRAHHRSVREHSILVNTPVITPRIPKVPVIEYGIADRLKSKAGIVTETDKMITKATDELTAYRKDLNKYQKQLSSKAKEFDKMKDENTSMRELLVSKDKVISSLTDELALTKDQINRLRNYPLKDVCNALNYDGPLVLDTGKPAWRNAIDMVKDVAGFDYNQAVAWLASQFGKDAAVEMASSKAIEMAAKKVSDTIERNDDLPYTKQEYAIAKELRKQLDTLGAESYRVTMFHQHGNPTYSLGKGRGVDGSEKLYSAAEVIEQVPHLNNENWRRGYNVFITPIDTNNHYVLVDDLVDETLVAMKAEGYAPNLVQKSSTSSIQAVFVLPKSDVDKGVGNAFFKQLNTSYGDQNIRGFIHPFRAAGFRNVKDKHKDELTSRFPIVTLLERVTGAVCKAALAACQAIAEATAGLAAATTAAAPSEAVQRRLRAALALPDVAVRGDVAAEAVAFYEWCSDRYGAPDWSRADWMLMQRLAKKGVPVDEIAAALREFSPGLVDRHPGVDKYVARSIVAHQVKAVDGYRK